MLMLLVMWFLLPQIKKELGCWFLLIKKDFILFFWKKLILLFSDSKKN